MEIVHINKEVVSSLGYNDKTISMLTYDDFKTVNYKIKELYNKMIFFADLRFIIDEIIKEKVK